MAVGHFNGSERGKRGAEACRERAGGGRHANKGWFGREENCKLCTTSSLWSSNEKETANDLRRKWHHLFLDGGSWRERDGRRERRTVINVTGCRWRRYTGRLIRIKAGAQLAARCCLLGHKHVYSGELLIQFHASDTWPPPFTDFTTWSSLETDVSEKLMEAAALQMEPWARARTMAAKTP